MLVRPDAALAEAPDLPGLDALPDGRLAVTYNPGKTWLLPCWASNITIADLDTEGAELETVFMKLTGNGSG